MHYLAPGCTKTYDRQYTAVRCDTGCSLFADKLAEIAVEPIGLFPERRVTGLRAVRKSQRSEWSRRAPRPYPGAR
jgi:hypothetical protein